MCGGRHVMQDLHACSESVDLVFRHMVVGSAGGPSSLFFHPAPAAPGPLLLPRHCAQGLSHAHRLEEQVRQAVSVAGWEVPLRRRPAGCGRLPGDLSLPAAALLPPRTLHHHVWM